MEIKTEGNELSFKFSGSTFDLFVDGFAVIEIIISEMKKHSVPKSIIDSQLIKISGLFDDSEELDFADMLKSLKFIDNIEKHAKDRMKADKNNQ